MPAKVRNIHTEKPIPSNADDADFEASDEELALLKSSRGRKPKPSVYAAKVQEAMKNGSTRVVRLSATKKAPWVMGQLRKAAKDLGIEKRISILNREEHGFVAYFVKPE
jgi:hypothetical protein